MRTVTTQTVIYEFEELSDEGKKKALDRYRYINVEFDWWDFMYEDAASVGLKITSFDLDRNRHAKGEFLLPAEEVASKILNEHGPDCETHLTAIRYVGNRAVLVAKYSEGTEKVTEDNEYEFDQECDELDAEFLKSLLEDYSILLQQECEYLTSDESIIKTLLANEYEFTVDGRIF